MNKRLRIGLLAMMVTVGGWALLAQHTGGGGTGTAGGQISLGQPNSWTALQTFVNGLSTTSINTNIYIVTVTTANIAGSFNNVVTSANLTGGDVWIIAPGTYNFTGQEVGTPGVAPVNILGWPGVVLNLSGLDTGGKSATGMCFWDGSGARGQSWLITSTFPPANAFTITTTTAVGNTVIDLVKACEEDGRTQQGFYLDHIVFRKQSGVVNLLGSIVHLKGVYTGTFINHAAMITNWGNIGLLVSGPMPSINGSPVVLSTSTTVCDGSKCTVTVPASTDASRLGAEEEPDATHVWVTPQGTKAGQVKWTNCAAGAAALNNTTVPIATHLTLTTFTFASAVNGSDTPGNCTYQLLAADGVSTNLAITSVIHIEHPYIALNNVAGARPLVISNTGQKSTSSWSAVKDIWLTHGEITGAGQRQYTTGTASFANGNATITGSGTAWTYLHGGGTITCTSGGCITLTAQILSVTNGTTLVLATPFGGTQAGATYTIDYEKNWEVTGNGCGNNSNCLSGIDPTDNHTE